ncbi:MAG: ankyrin repeat domain-containing protein [Alphaproteobacteria bacterium]|nr:ankyrin repeat domain-containing protein [Alphaproteobacteria bacterium]
MPFRADDLWLPFSETARAVLLADPVLRRGVYHLPAAVLLRCDAPADGLLVVRSLVPPAEARGREIPWDAVWSPPGEHGFDDAGDRRGWPPNPFLRRMVALAQALDTPVAYHRIETHGGEILAELAWVADGVQRRVIRPADVADTLQAAMAHLGVVMPSPWFAPHTSSFDWAPHALSASPSEPVPGSLVCALLRGDREEAARCLARGVELDPKDPEPLHLAASLGDEDLVAGLLAAGVVPGASTLASAASMPVALLLRAAGARLDHARLLEDAAAHAPEDVVRWLLAEGATPTRGTWYAAAAGGHSWLLEQLAEPDVDRHETGRYADRTALELAARRGHRDTVAWLVVRGARATERSVVEAAREGRLDVVLDLLALGVTPRARVYRATALMEAARGGHVDVIEALVAAGADLRGTGPSGDDALKVAALHGRLPAVRRLLALGLDPNHADDAGRTALWSAVGGGHADVVQALLTAGADPEITVHGTTLGDFARSRGLEV